MSEAEQAGASAIVLDYLPHGRSDEGRPRYEQAPVAQALGVEDFRLYELVLDGSGSVSIGDKVTVRPPADPIEEFRELTYADLSSGAQSELEYVVAELVADQEARFLEIYNEAGPITLRLHQLTLLSGIGDKLRDDILDARKRGPFESFEEVGERISGLHDPEGVIVDRILEEIQDPDLKYHLFAGGPY